MTDIVKVSDLAVTQRRYAARLGNVLAVVPDMKAITDTAGSPNSMNVVSDLGLPIPSAAPSLGTTNVGTGSITFQNYPQEISYYVAFYSAQGKSNPVYCGKVTIISPSDVTIDLPDITNEASHALIQGVIIYRNLTGTGTTFFPVATVAVASMGSAHTDNVPNATAAASSPTLELDNFGPLNGAAPGASTYGLIAAHMGYIVMAGPHNHRGGTDYDHSYILSKLNNPHAYPTRGLNYIERGRYGVIRAVHPQGSGFTFYKEECIARLRFLTNPMIAGGDGSLITNAQGRGAVNQRTVVNIDGVHYVMDKLGIYVHTNGIELNEIGQPLQSYWRRINWTPAVAEKFCATYDEDAIRFFVALDADTAPRHCFVLNLRGIRSGRGVVWATHEYNFGFTDADRLWLGTGTAAVAHGMAGQMWPVAVTENGYPMILGAGYRDGVHPFLTGEGVVSGTPSTTQFDVSGATLSYTNATTGLVSTVKGCHVQFLDSNGLETELPIREITAVSGTTITVAALPRAPVAGERVVIGGLPNTVLRFPPHDLTRDPMARKLLKGIMLRYEKRGMDFDVRVGLRRDNRSVSGAQQITASDTYDGIDTVEGDPYYHVKMGGALDGDGRLGKVRINPGRELCRTAAVEIDASGVDKPAQINSMVMEVGSVS